MSRQQLKLFTRSCVLQTAGTQCWAGMSSIMMAHSSGMHIAGCQEDSVSLSAATQLLLRKNNELRALEQRRISAQ